MNEKKFRRRGTENENNGISHFIEHTTFKGTPTLSSFELSEAFEAWIKKHDNLGEELADTAIYLMGLSQILGIDLEAEVEKKMKINESREYVKVNGVLVKKGSKDDI